MRPIASFFVACSLRETLPSPPTTSQVKVATQELVGLTGEEAEFNGRVCRVAETLSSGRMRVEFLQAPQPSDHVLAQWKAGEIVYQAGELPKALRVSKTHYEIPKTVCTQ